MNSLVFCYLLLFSKIGVSARNVTDLISQDPRCLPECVYQKYSLEKNSSFPTNCTTVCVPAGLYINSEMTFTESQLADLFKNMKHLIGSLDVSHTSYTSMKFLSNLESIDCYNTGNFWITHNSDMTEIGMPNLSNVSCLISIISNSNLERLNLPKITPTFSSLADTKLEKIYMYAYANARNFCINVDEMSNLMSYNNGFTLDKSGDTSGNYCELSNSSVFNQKTCNIKNTKLENLDSDCVNLYGNLTIKHEDEGNIQKLESVETIFGYLKINGTNLTSLNFLGKLKNIWSLTGDNPAILVENNQLLTDITLPSLQKVFAPTHTRFSFNKNNEGLLKDPSICYGFRKISNEWGELTVKFDGETYPRCLPGCFFKPIRLEKRFLKLFPTNCSTVCAPNGLSVDKNTDLNESQLTETLKNVKQLVGVLNIAKTNFKSCKFFENLESIECYNIFTVYVILNPQMTEIGMTNLTNASCRFFIAYNYNLTRLNMPKLIPTPSQFANYSQVNVEFDSNSDDFCVTVEEMMHFTTHDTVFERLSRTIGKYCEMSNATIYPQKTCDVQKTTLERLETGCVNLGGDLIIEKGDEWFVHKLESVETIYGRLQINGTNLTNLNFLGNLQRVMSITKNQPSILVEHNPNLINVSLPSLKRVESTIFNSIQFNNNNRKLLEDPVHCSGIRDKLDKDDKLMVRFDWKGCDGIHIAASPPVKENSSIHISHVIVLMVGIFNTL
ncbi:unnamed protein product [Caenorhabditis brenneri]